MLGSVFDQKIDGFLLEFISCTPQHRVRYGPHLCPTITLGHVFPPVYAQIDLQEFFHPGGDVGHGMDAIGYLLYGDVRFVKTLPYVAPQAS